MFLTNTKMFLLLTCRLSLSSSPFLPVSLSWWPDCCHLLFIVSFPFLTLCLSLTHTHLYSMTRQNHKNREIKATLLPALHVFCLCLLPLSWAHVLSTLPMLDSNRCLSVHHSVVCVFVWVCLYKACAVSEPTLRSFLALLLQMAMVIMQQMSQLIEKSVPLLEIISLTSTAAACGWGLSRRYPRVLSHRVNQSSLPPPDPSLPPSVAFLSSSLQILLWVSGSLWLGCGGCLPPSLSVTLLLLPLSPCLCCSQPFITATPLSPALSFLFSLLIFLPPILSVFHSLASLFSTPLLIAGKSLLKTNFCLPLTQCKG